MATIKWPEEKGGVGHSAAASNTIKKRKEEKNEQHGTEIKKNQ